MGKKFATPQCEVCKWFYNQSDVDESGLCPECRPENIEPDLVVAFQPEMKREWKGEGFHMEQEEKKEEEKEIDLQDEDDVEDQVEKEEKTQETLEEKVNEMEGNNPTIEAQAVTEPTELRIEDIIQPGVFGVSNAQMIPAIRAAVEEGSVEKLKLLKKVYYYTFDRSLRYLRKKDKAFLKEHGI